MKPRSLQCNYKRSTSELLLHQCLHTGNRTIHSQEHAVNKESKYFNWKQSQEGARGKENERLKRGEENRGERSQDRSLWFLQTNQRQLSWHFLNLTVPYNLHQYSPSTFPLPQRIKAFPSGLPLFKIIIYLMLSLKKTQKQITSKFYRLGLAQDVYLLVLAFCLFPIHLTFQ